MIRSELRPGVFFQHSNKERPIIYISMAKSRENLFYLEAQHLNPKNPARIEILKHGIQSGMDNKEIYLCLDMDGRAWTTYGNSEVSRIPYDDKLYTEVIAFYDRKRKALLETFKFDPSDLKDKASGCPWCAAGIPPTARVGAQMVTIEVTEKQLILHPELFSSQSLCDKYGLDYDKEVERVRAEMAAADVLLKIEKHEPPDATQRLYEDQRGYLKREEERGRKAQSDRFIAVLKTVEEHTQKVQDSDHKSDDIRAENCFKIRSLLLDATEKIEEARKYMKMLDHHGWGWIPKAEEDKIRSKFNDFDAFLKAHQKKHRR